MITAASLAVMSLSAQSKIDLPARLLLNDLDSARVHHHAPAAVESLGVVVMLESDVNSQAVIDEIDGLGGSVSVDLGKILVVNIPADKLVGLSELAGVKYVELGTESHLMLDYARRSGHVDAAHSGEVTVNGMPTPFDGKGVITALFDQGIDPNHAAFSGRTKTVYSYSNGNVTRYETPAEVAGFTTDDNFETHGTHVAGIMAGSYNGDGTYGYVESPTGSDCMIKTAGMPFYGVATGSDIVFATGALTSANVIAGVNDIVAKAEAEGKPAVINLSLGINNGPHDGSDALSTALSELGKRAVICLSAGNEGNYKLCVSKSFTTADKEVKTFIAGGTGATVDIWGSDRNPLTVKVVLYNIATGAVQQLSEITKAGQTKAPAAAFSSYFSGTYAIVSEVNPLNDRFHVTLSGSFSPKTGDRYIGIIVTGRNGQSVSLYGNAETTFTDYGVEGWTDGSTDGSINSIAAGANLLSVGAYTSRTSWGRLNGSADFLDGDFQVGKICKFSSYGTSFQGERLPLVCAPGANIVSAYNSHLFTIAGSDALAKVMTAKVENGALASYWGAMYGTSMSSPFVAGVVALWLEADPMLTFDDVLAVINTTSELPDGAPENDYLRWGAGRIDAVAGLKAVLKSGSGVGTVAVDDESRLIVTSSGRQFDVFVAGAGDVSLSLYTLAGTVAARAAGEHGEAHIDTSALLSGVYLLSVDSSTGHFTRRVMVK